MAQSEEPAKPKRRILRAAPTVREKREASAQKAEKKIQKPEGIWRLTRHYIGAPFRMAGRGLKRGGRVLARFKVFRIIGYILVPPYFRSSWHELRQVTWPGWRDTWKLTFAVIVFSIIFGVLVMVTDFGLDKLFRNILLQ